MTRSVFVHSRGFLISVCSCIMAWVHTCLFCCSEAMLYCTRSPIRWLWFLSCYTFWQLCPKKCKEYGTFYIKWADLIVTAVIFILQDIYHIKKKKLLIVIFWHVIRHFTLIRDFLSICHHDVWLSCAFFETANVHQRLVNILNKIVK